jgi:hypothetical protein
VALDLWRQIESKLDTLRTPYGNQVRKRSPCEACGLVFNSTALKMESKFRQRVLTSGICALFLGLSWLAWAHTNRDSVAPNKVSQREAAGEAMRPILTFPCRSKRGTFPGSCPVRPASGVIKGSGFENSSNFYSQGQEDRNVLERYF